MTKCPIKVYLIHPYVSLSIVLLHYFVYIHLGVVDHQSNNVTSKLDKMQHLSSKQNKTLLTNKHTAYKIEL